MDQTAPANELERRKQVRIRLRDDIQVDAQKYEGRTYYVVKDPVALRYYRLKDNEHFLLQFLDGKHTLEEAQKAYEKRFRPDRLRLEDLEAFAQQLLTAGLARSESPRAGKLLYERRNKRKKSEFMQRWTNILYIKIPVIDPDRILNWMVRWLGWTFSGWFFALALGLMTAAALLVLTHFETFRSKLPDYHEFFSFKTVIYLWMALGVVKVIHEFGHGLSCKKFGGEVHEMGALFLCLSPCLYCNVSDAWTLPSKWHRIIISAAGIYVELVIAALATFIWWNTPHHPFINNLSLSLMVVCSVSTVVFNANPLLRYDGYYVVADWLEIPNLREKSNRYLKHLAQEVCLGIEVPPEGYMELWRKILFVVYAVVSYIYRWVITFVILRFMWSFLKPYGLEVISSMLALAAMISMIAWPAYNLGKNLHRRGRLPDMKRGHVIVTSIVASAVLLAFFFLPLPISRIRGVGLVESRPDGMSQLFVRRNGCLVDLRVQPGDWVVKGQELARFRDEDLELELEGARTDQDSALKELGELRRELDPDNPTTRKDDLKDRLQEVQGALEEARSKIDVIKGIQKNDLVIRANRDGIIGQAPLKEERYKQFEKVEPRGPAEPLFTIHEPGKLQVLLPVETPEFNRLKESLSYGDGEVILRVQGMDSRTWQGKIRLPLPKSELSNVPLALSSKTGGPVAVRAQPSPTGALMAQTQHYPVYIDIVDPDPALMPGNMAQVKIYCRPETCATWVWRKINDMFNLKLL
jgi:putative peptide zinc metalloprotease protein